MDAIRKPHIYLIVALILFFIERAIEKMFPDIGASKWLMLAGTGVILLCITILFENKIVPKWRKRNLETKPTAFGGDAKPIKFNFKLSKAVGSTQLPWRRRCTQWLSRLWGKRNKTAFMNRAERRRRAILSMEYTQESAKFGERQEIICEYRDILYDQKAKSDHEKARRGLAGICDAFNIKHPGIPLRYFAIIGYEDSWQIFASKLTEFARNEDLKGARAILKPPADEK